MPEAFLALSQADKAEALQLASQASGRPMHVLEKDAWVVWALEVLFTSDFRDSLVFKGGTSLSKAYGIIERFSEDVDVTYDIRSLVPDMAAESPNALPANRSQEKRWTKAIRDRLPQWVEREVSPLFSAAIASQNLQVQLRLEGDKLFLKYNPASAGSGYIAPVVLVEFGARSTGDPCGPKPVFCDAAPLLPTLAFPSATPRVMHPERTFWEKATAIHVFCAQGEFRGGQRFARHWYDLAHLHRAGFVASASRDLQLRKSVAAHKSAFFAEKRADGSLIDYEEAVRGRLQLIPTEAPALKSLADDYRRMADDGLFAGAILPWLDLLHACRVIEDHVNRPSELL